MSTGIYRIINIKNGKFYIGSSKNIERRWLIHKSRLRNNKHVNCLLQRSWNKHGENIFKIEILECCNEDRLFEKEQLYLDFHEPCYNIGIKAIGGDNLTNNPNRDKIIEKIVVGLHNRHDKMSDEDKKKRSDNLKGEKNPNFGNNWSEKSKKEASDRQIEYFKTHEQYNKGKKLEDIHNADKAKKIREKISKLASSRTGEKNSFHGKHHTNEYKEKSSERRIGKYCGNQNIPFAINGKKYKSLGEASKELKIHITTIRWRLKSNNSKFSEYVYL